MSTTRPALWHGLSPCHNDIPAATAVALADMRAGRGWLPSVVAFGIALGCGLAITLAQLILACLLSDGATLRANLDLVRANAALAADLCRVMPI